MISLCTFCGCASSPHVPMVKGGNMETRWEWKSHYDSALQEKDDHRRHQRMQAAKNAIVDRLEDSLHGREPLTSAERVQIEEACRELLLLRSQRAA